MNEFKEVLGFDVEKLAKDADRFFAQVKEMQEAGTAVTARAESGDGRAAVEYSSSEGVRKLEIDPRAMRMSAQELAETILNLIRRAQREVESKGQAQLTAFLGDDNTLISQRDAIGKQLHNSTSALTENLKAATEMLDKLQGKLRR